MSATSAPSAILAPHFGLDLLSRVEDAGLNASAPLQQRWVDGWLLRFCPGSARRARCINALKRGRLALAQKLAQCETVYREHGLPLLIRLTPFTEPATLDRELAMLGMPWADETRVMLRRLPGPVPTTNLPDGCALEQADADAYAHAVGVHRGSPIEQRTAMAVRLQNAPVPLRSYLVRDRSGLVIAGAQVATEGRFVGLFDVFTAPAHQGAGVASAVCSRLLAQARERGAHVAYLQVSHDNDVARRLYQRLGFADAYSYCYCGPGLSDK